MHKIKILGERNSGTNYLEKLVALNLNAEILRYYPRKWVGPFLRYETLLELAFELSKKKYLGWKHGKPRVREINNFPSDHLSIITITKNPYSYLLSLYKRPYHYRGDKWPDFRSFLDCKWNTILMDNCGLKQFDSPIYLWNEKNKAYLELKNQVNKPVINLRYEDLIENPEKIMHMISKETGTTFKGGHQFQNISTSSKGDQKTFTDYQTYYLEEQWKEKIGASEIDFINQRLDFELVEAFGYQKLEG